ncbi:RpiB/LacA/LacB family sugar-phosphate isomerase [Candidatus Woesearchaeota archaeon]|nr:RpiB/LacA/LacB family sugar-phosphate isomerase [Candidatus Woesearchaeota archaeon]
MKQEKPTIFFGTDHAGYKLKEALKGFLSKQGYSIKDFGAFSEESVDYPDFISPVAKAVAKNPSGSRGIILGGSGQGEAITANRVKGVRAAVFYGGPEKIIILSREHNDANILSLGARFVAEKQAQKAVKLWLETPFPGEERHKRRIKKIDGL